MEHNTRAHSAATGASATRAEAQAKTAAARRLAVQRVDVLDLQQAMVANQLVPIIRRSEPGDGVPFSALND